MPFSARTALLVLAVFCTLSCAKQDDSKTKVSALVVPADEATEQEREIIDRTLTELEQLSAELGQARSFRSIPVLVTSEKPEDSRRYAACFLEGGKGKFIQVNRQVLRREKDIFKGTTSTFFQVLLHEIGHCYYGRHHLDDQIDVSKYHVSQPEGDHSRRREIAILSFNGSAMHSKNMIVLNVMKKYYVAEIIGLVPALNVRALQDFTPFTFVERKPEEVLP